jgi:hypothetical protein
MVRLCYSIAICFVVIGCSRPASDFTAVEFHDHFKDRKAAYQRFEGKTVAIRGEVLSVGDSWLTPAGWKTVELGQERAGVICQFTKDSADQADRLSVGQSVVIRGICKGDFSGSPILSECVVVR